MTTFFPNFKNFKTYFFLLNLKFKNHQKHFKLYCSSWIPNDGWWAYGQKQLSKSIFIFKLYV